MPISDHSYDPFPVTSDEWAGRDPFANKQNSRKSSPEQPEPDSTVKSRTPSPSADSSKQPKDYSVNPSPQFSDQLSVDTHGSTVISPISKQSVSSMESGYESSVSTPPNSVQMRNTNITSPVFQQEAIPELIPAHASNSYYKQKPQISFAQNKNPFQSPKQYQTPSPNFPVNPMTNLLGGYVKQEPYYMHQCAGNKRNHQSVEHSAANNTSQDLNRNVNPVLGVDMLMSSFNDHIPPIAPLKELKTEDLDILEIPTVSSQNVQEIPVSMQWPQNIQYISNGEQFGISINSMMPRSRQGNFVLNPQQQQHPQQQQPPMNGLQPQCLYHINQQ